MLLLPSLSPPLNLSLSRRVHPIVARGPSCQPHPLTNHSTALKTHHPLLPHPLRYPLHPRPTFLRSSKQPYQRLSLLARRRSCSLTMRSTSRAARPRPLLLLPLRLILSLAPPLFMSITCSLLQSSSIS